MSKKRLIILIVKISILLLGAIAMGIIYLLNFNLPNDMKTLEKEVRVYANDRRIVEKSEDIYILDKEELENSLTLYFQNSNEYKHGIAIFERGINKKYKLVRLHISEKNGLVNIEQLEEGKAVYYGDSMLIDSIIMKNGEEEISIKTNEMGYFLKTEDKPKANFQGISLYDESGHIIENVLDYMSLENSTIFVKDANLLSYFFIAICVIVLIAELVMSVKFKLTKEEKKEKKLKKKEKKRAKKKAKTMNKMSAAKKAQGLK